MGFIAPLCFPCYHCTLKHSSYVLINASPLCYSLHFWVLPLYAPCSLLPIQCPLVIYDPFMAPVYCVMQSMLLIQVWLSLSVLSQLCEHTPLAPSPRNFHLFKFSPPLPKCFYSQSLFSSHHLDGLFSSLSLFLQQANVWCGSNTSISYWYPCFTYKFYLQEEFFACFTVLSSSPEYLCFFHVKNIEHWTSQSQAGGWAMMVEKSPWPL